ncbi:MAG: acetyl-CoA acyltransferase, partial [Solirubrobacteraceae bacterium]|nr:acetyl-CoA acyltransferase [Solirubrobacteraceae bacterium]
MSNRTYVIGVGMTKFDKPGTKDGDYPDWAKEAGEMALADAGIPYEDVEQAFAGYCYGDSTYGQRCLYQLGMTGIPVVNVNNNCSTGSSALFLARQAVMSGIAECAIAIGFEKMEPGSLGMKYTDRTPAMDKHLGAMIEGRGNWEAAPPAPQMFGNAGREHMELYGSTPDHYAWIGYKNHKHSVNNPYAQFQTEYTLQEIKDAKEIFAPLTKLQCSPTSDGAGCAIIASEKYVEAHDLWDTAIELAGQSMVTDFANSFEGGSSIRVCGFEMSKAAGERALAQANTDISEVDVIELHDCFSANELITYEALGIAKVGEGHLLVDKQATTYGGDGPVVNPSGGLISKGHPLGATGLAQCAELTWQLRGTADKRQVDGAKVAL